MFILLGQLVAISFAANLFFLAILLHPIQDGKQSSHNSSKSKTKHWFELEMPQWLNSTGFWNVAILIATLQVALSITTSLDSPQFMLLLLAPHVLAFFPTVISWFTRDEYPEITLQEPALYLKAAVMSILISWQTAAIYRAGLELDDVVSALHAHPAVSSVGWDVICCWVSFVLWEVSK